MKRDIRFKAWHPGKKEWAYGGTSFSIMGEITAHGFPDYLLEDMLAWKIVQFAGFLDSKGAEIYEGDIIEGVPLMRFNPDTRIRGFVFFDEHKGMWKVQVPGLNDEQDIEYLFEICKSNQPKIIGNIYQNTELLKP